MLPVPTLSYLALFTGRDETSYSPFAEQALAQATLMFSTITKLETYSDDADAMQLAINAILQMAERLYLEQPYAAVRANPFNAETVMSYSYSKGVTSVVSKVVANELTGLFWWDLAIEELSLIERSLVTFESIEVFNRDLYHTTSGARVLPGPADIQYSQLLPPPQRSGTWPGEDFPERSVDSVVFDVNSDVW